MATIVSATFTLENTNDMWKVLPIFLESRDSCLQSEPGTKQFEVSTLNDHSNKIFVYEVYENAAAHKAHLEGDARRIAYEKGVALGVKFSAEIVQGTRVD